MFQISLFKFLLLLIGSTLSTAKPQLSPSLVSLLNQPQNFSTSQTHQKLTLLLSMKEGRSVTQLVKDLPKLTQLNHLQKLTSIVKALKQESNKVQLNLLNHLTEQKKSTLNDFQINQLWITNQIILKNVDLSLVNKLLERQEIFKIEQEFYIPIDPPIDLQIELKNLTKDKTKGVQWGVANIHAPSVWTDLSNTGQNVVVGSIDTGVRSTHEALRDNYRSDHGWFDPIDGTLTPNDQHGHGSHVLGVIVGSNGIGVAPGSQYIACRGCGLENCGATSLLQCGQFMMCPTDALGENEDCSKAPNLINNSWGGNNEFYDKVIEAWRVSGLIPIFSIGNSGPSCGSTVSPGNHPEVIGVGSVTTANHLSSFSSLGPVRINGTVYTKPDLVAPGSLIRSAYFESDDQYATMSGSSMAAPHVSGLVALLLSHNSSWNYEQIKELLQRGATKTSGLTDLNCGGIGGDVFPNNFEGYGKIDALNSFPNAKFQELSNGNLLGQCFGNIAGMFLIFLAVYLIF